jgi:hypothetical protein
MSSAVALCAVLVLTLVSACTPLDFLGVSGANPRPGPDDVAVTIRDQHGLVVRHEFVPDAQMPEGTEPTSVGVVNPHGRDDQLLVTWLTLPCQKKPSVSIAPAADSLALVVDRGPLPSDGCDSMGEVFGVLLQMSRPWSASRVRGSVARTQEP